MGSSAPSEWSQQQQQLSATSRQQAEKPPSLEDSMDRQLEEQPGIVRSSSGGVSLPRAGGASAANPMLPLQQISPPTPPQHGDDGMPDAE